MTRYYTPDMHPSWCFCSDCGGGKGGETQEKEIEPEIEWFETICDYIETQISNITEQVRKAANEPMIRRSNNRSGGRMPQNGLPNLTLANLSLNKMRFTILDAWEPEGENKFGFAVIVKIELNGGPRFLWNLKDNNPCLDILEAALGKDESKWKDHEGYIFLEENPRDEKRFARCEMISEKDKAAAAKKST